MVGREHRDDRLGIERVERGHREGDRGGIPARVRLDDDVVRAQLGQLLVDERAVLGRCHRERALGRDDLRDPIDGVLQERALPDEVEELLRLRSA